VGAWGESSARRRRQPGRYSAGLPESSPELDGVSGTIVPANRAELLSGWQRSRLVVTGSLSFVLIHLEAIRDNCPSVDVGKSWSP